MRIIVAKDYDSMSRKAARMVAGQIYLKPDSVLGLATGSTPELMYQELVKDYHDSGLDFSEIKTFNLDEYVGLPATDKNSYHYYMHHKLFDLVNINPENIHIPNGESQDIAEECASYDQQIKAAGGIDFQVLGIGKNGHIGFNEPDIKFEGTTHLVKLDEETIAANARFFSSTQAVPKFALSMGIKNIMLARKILLLASGEEKAEAIYRTIYGKITPVTPASILQLHQDVTVIVEEGAAGLLLEGRAKS
jgi:glucosamine-6-phosphate deaminase